MPRKSDLQKVAAVLQEGHESAEDAAVAVIECWERLRRERLRYGLAVQGLPVAYVYGDFENRQEAVNWAKRSGLDVVGLSVGVIPIRDKDFVLERHQKMTDEVKKKNEPEPLPARRPRGRRAA